MTNFMELSQDELMETEGGGVFTAVVIALVYKKAVAATATTGFQVGFAAGASAGASTALHNASNR